MWSGFFPFLQESSWAALSNSKTVDVKESGRETVETHIYSRFPYEFRNLGLDVWLPLFLIKGIHIILI